MGEDRGSSRRRRAPAHGRKRDRWRRRWRLGIVAGLTGLCALAAPATRPATPAAAATATADPWQSWSYDGFWAMDRPLADPGALYADGQVVVYGTSARQCILSSCATYWVPRFTSTSPGATAGLQSDALPGKPAWVSSSDRVIWAPAVAEIGGVYVMYFAATAGSGALNAGLKCVGAAVASTADGPFLPLTTALVCGSPGWWAIDPYVFADGADLYLLWREDDAAQNRGKIVSAPLSADGVSLVAGAPRQTLVIGEYPWEDGSLAAAAAAPDGAFDRRLPPAVAGLDGSGSGTGAVAVAGIGPIENPAMVRHPATGELLLTWSANSWNTQSYATGLATCASPLGPCERISREQPWLTRSGEGGIATTAAFGGAGGLSFLNTGDGALYAAFHAYRGTHDARTASRITWIYQVVHSPDGYRLAEF